jgi:hypothetical protein
MKYRTWCPLIIAALLWPLATFAADEGGAPAEELTIEQKVERAHKLLDRVRAGPKAELLELIHEVGVANFLEPVLDDKEKLLDVAEVIMNGASTVEGSMTRADLFTYLLNDERPDVVRVAVDNIAKLALYCDKPYVGKALFELYKNAADDADLRAAVATAICRVASPDIQGREPRRYTPEDVSEALDRIPTLLKDPDPGVRRAAVENLMRAVSIMHRLGLGDLEDDPDPGVRAAVLDYYGEAKVRTRHVVEVAIKALGSSDLEEVEVAFKYCRKMELDEAREAMFGAVKRYAATVDDPDMAKRIGSFKYRVLELAIERGWKEAAPDLLWIVENDQDPDTASRAAYVMLTLLDHPTVSLGTAEEQFPEYMLETERRPLMKAFKAWVIESYEKQGLTPEVQRLREEAQIEFSDKVHQIAAERLRERNVACVRRGLRLVLEMGPEEFAGHVDTEQEAKAITSALVRFHEMMPRTESGRQVARVLLAFVDNESPTIRMGVMNMLTVMAMYCDKDVFIPVVSKLTGDLHPEVAEAAGRLVAAVEARGYSLREQEKRRYREGPADPDAD